MDPYDTEAQAPHKIVSFTSGFHGRTMGALALTYKTAYKAPFAPSLPGAVCIPYLDLEAAKQTIQKVGPWQHLRCLMHGWAGHACLVLTAATKQDMEDTPRCAVRCAALTVPEHGAC